MKSSLSSTQVAALSARFLRFYMGLLSLSAVAMVLLAAVTAEQGIGLTPDSITYIAGARNVQAGAGYPDSQGEYLVYWPPKCWQLWPQVLQLQLRG